jgi:formylglycine-generating enzyme required for sulfatase activity
MQRVAAVLALVLAGGGAVAGEGVRDCAACPDMVAIPGGLLAREGAAPPVAVAPFLLGRTEVTFDQWQACVAAGGCRGGQDDHGWGRGDRPVINVTFADAEAYVDWLRAATGRAYRLPDEDEWEWAARGGTTTAYWWGEEVGEGHANCRHCGSRWGGHESAPVGSFPANPYGLRDMAGNLWEWTATCWADDRAAPPAARDCQRRVAKGGAWYYIPAQARPASRAPHRVGLFSYTVGLRVAAPVPAPD